MKKGIIVVSFGTSHGETRKLCIESIENRVREIYGEFLVLRAFTSQIVINKLKARDNYQVLNPREALEKMKAQGIKEIYIQPLHIILGHEYEKLLRQVKGFLEENNDYTIKIGKPLLNDNEDYEKAVDGLKLPDLKADEGIVFMGHGTSHEADISYDKLERTLRTKGYNNIFVATVEGSTTIEDIIPRLKDKEIRKVYLRPFMLVAGVHVVEDMASHQGNSWKSILEKEGFDVEPILEGLGQLEKIQDIYIDHLQRIMD